MLNKVNLHLQQPGLLGTPGSNDHAEKEDPRLLKAGSSAKRSVLLKCRPLGPRSPELRVMWRSAF